MKIELKTKMLRAIAASTLMVSGYPLLGMDKYEWHKAEIEEIIPIKTFEAADGEGKQGYNYTTITDAGTIKKSFAKENEVLVLGGAKKDELKIKTLFLFAEGPGDRKFFKKETLYEFNLTDQIIQKEAAQTKLEE